MATRIATRLAGTLLIGVLSAVGGCRPGAERGAASVARAEPASEEPPSSVTFHAVGARPRAIAAADFNGDNRLDVVVANGGDSSVTILLGDGRSRFRSSRAFAAGPEPADINAVDVDRDGDVDLVVANHETPRITVLLNNGLGNFVSAPRSPYETGAQPHVHSVATADFDGDELIDVAVESADTREVRVLKGGASRGLAPAVAVNVETMPYSSLGVGNVVGDAHPDLLVPGHRDNTVRFVEYANERYRLAELTISLGRQPWTVVAGDINADGRDDLVVVESGGISVWLRSDRGFNQATGSPYAIAGATEAAIGDLNGDGRADIVVSRWDGDEASLLISGAGPPRGVRLCERAVGLAIADVDGNGRDELLATCMTTNRIAVATFPRAR